MEASVLCFLNRGMTISQFHNEVCERLRLDRPWRDEFNIKLADLYYQLCDPPHCFVALENSCQWSIGYDPNNMHKEVVLEHPGHHEDYIEQLLYLRVCCLSILQDLVDKVHGLLFNFHHGFRPFNDDDCDDNGVGGCDVQ
jgi:hypothetical protein